MRCAYFAVFLLAGCASIMGDKGDNNSGQGENKAGGSGLYSITSLYDGDAGSRERAAKWMDTEARNICASDYTRISEESVPTINRLGEVPFSRLIWQVKCAPQPERAAPP
jgi:uncharacterized protein YceK